MDKWIIAILFLVLGIVLVLFSHRIGQWWQRVGGSFILRIAPWRKSPEKDIDELMDEWAKSRWHIWDIIGIWFMRITGVFITLGGALVLYLLISQL